RFHGRLEALREASIGQQALGFADVALVEASPGRRELIDRNGPLFQRGGDRGVRHAVSQRPCVGFEDLFPVIRYPESAADADIPKRLAVELHRRIRAEEYDERLRPYPHGTLASDRAC